METLEIKNFCGIKHYKIDVKNINIFIGNQGTGKSVTAKLLFFFKSIPDLLFNGSLIGNGITDFRNDLLSQFITIFPIDSIKPEEFFIIYTNDRLSLKIYSKLKGNKVSLAADIPDLYKKILSYQKNVIRKINQLEDISKIVIDKIELRKDYLKKLTSIVSQNISFHQEFVPAGRSFYSILQSNIFHFVSDNNKALDYFMIKFGMFYEEMKRVYSHIDFKNNTINLFNDIINRIIKGKYFRSSNKDFIIHDDNRRVNLSFSSSGQQEVLPLVIILISLLGIRFSGDGITLYIEEPETHLFPESQKLIVELMAAVYNQSSQNVQFVITTHSPYILSSFNNLILAKQLNDKSEKVKSIIPDFKQVDVTDISVYGMDNKKATDLIDKETGLIGTNFIDSCSELIADEFNSLLECTDEL